MSPASTTAGDVAEFYDSDDWAAHVMGTWDNALAHGRIVATNMAGGHEPYVDVPTYTSPLFDTNIAVMGIAESNNPALESFSKMAPGDKGNTDYRKYFFKDNRLVGSVFIGSPKGRKKMVELIRRAARTPRKPSVTRSSTCGKGRRADRSVNATANGQKWVSCWMGCESAHLRISRRSSAYGMRTPGQPPPFG